MKRLLFILLFVAATAPVLSQSVIGPTGDLWQGDYILFENCDTCNAGYLVRLDTMALKADLAVMQNWLDSLRTAGYFPSGSGGRAFLRDIDPDRDAIDSTGALYTLKYMPEDEIVLQGFATWGSADTTRIAFGGQYGFLTSGVWGADTLAPYEVYRMDWIETNGRGSCFFPPTVPPMLAALDSAWHINVRKTTTGAYHIDQVTLYRYAPSTATSGYSPAPSTGLCVAVIGSGSIYGGWGTSTPIINAQFWLTLRRKR